MRIRLSLEIRLDRDQPEDTTPEPPTIIDGNYANTERAQPHPIGFSIDMPDHDQ